MTNDTLPARRLKIKTGENSYVGVSACEGATNEQVCAETLRIIERAEWGHARKVVSIDGGSGFTWFAKVIASYIEMYYTIAYRATIGRRATLHRIEHIRKVFASSSQW